MTKTTPAPHVSSIWMDSPERYGLVSRALHWGMAYLLLWQAVTVLSWYVFGASEIHRAILSYGLHHRTVGMLTLLLVIVRVVWTILNRKRRPPYKAGWPGWFASAGHAAIYLLMFLIPALAIMRVYASGNGRGSVLFGVQLVPSTGDEVEWMLALDRALHGPLSWMLFALIAGHIVMALHHRFIRRDRSRARMAGRLREGGELSSPLSTRSKEVSDVA